jgi:hypothetical protein
VPEGAGGRPLAAKVHAFDEAVGGDNVERAARRLDDGGVVADAERHPEWGAPATAQALDERVLAGRLNGGAIGRGSSRYRRPGHRRRLSVSDHRASRDPMPRCRCLD